MKTYQKIETLYRFDQESKRFIDGEFYNPYVEYLKNNMWVGSEKIDGTNIRVLWTGYDFQIAGRKDTSGIPKEVMALFESTFNKEMEICVEQIFGNKEVIFCMEAYAGKIQGKIYAGDEKFIGFDIMVEEAYLKRIDAFDIFDSLEIETVPVFYFNNLQEAINMVKSNPQSIIDNTAKMEGLVCLPKERIYDNQGNRICTKIKHRDLLKTK